MHWQDKLLSIKSCATDVSLNHLSELIVCVSLNTLLKKVEKKIATGMVLNFQTKDTQRHLQTKQGLGYDFIMMIIISPNQLRIPFIKFLFKIQLWIILEKTYTSCVFCF